MKHRIAAGVLVEQGGKVPLVRHLKPGVYDFWVAPGGGAEGIEDLRATAKREVLEECGLHVETGAIAYIEEFSNPEVRECKIWFAGQLLGGTQFEGKVVFPHMLLREYWEDTAAGFPSPSSGHPPAGFACLRLPLMSNVRPHCEL